MRRRAAAPRRASVGRRLAADGLILIVLAVIAEVAVRGLAPRYLEHKTDAQYTGGFRIELNPDGSRGVPVAVEKAPGVFRVLCLGDSATFGTGVAADATFAKRIAPMLRESWGGEVESINAGVPGCAVKDLGLALQDRWAAYRPDVVVLTVSGNCASWAWVRREDCARMQYAEPTLDRNQKVEGLRERVKASVASLKHGVKSLIHEAALPSFLRLNSERVLYEVGLLDHVVDPKLPLGCLLAYGWQQADIPDEVRAGVLESFDRELQAFVHAAAALGIPVVVAVAPPSFTISERAIDNEKSVPRARLGEDFGGHVAAVCRKLGVAYADVPGAMRAAREAGPRALLYRQMDYTHFSPRGHDVAATAIAGVISADRGVFASAAPRAESAGTAPTRPGR